MPHDDPHNPHHHDHKPATAASGAQTLHGVPASKRAPKAKLAELSGAQKILHFDCFSGLSGDMIVGALLDLGVPPEPLQEALEALPMDGFAVGAVDVEVHSLAATKFVVEVDRAVPDRRWSTIRAMLELAPLKPAVRERALKTFALLAAAEGKVHGISPEEVHFHEVGAVDSIVDIVAASAALAYLNATVTCAPLPMGRGFAKTAHGVIPLPAPAVVQLLDGAPTRYAGIDGELVTPTGAAIVRANASAFVEWPAIAPICSGLGAGTKVWPDRPNVLRVVLGTPSEQTEKLSSANATTVTLLESNLDDVTGEAIAHCTAALLREGALDAWTENIVMKKSRPALKLCALSYRHDAQRLARVMLRESPTIGVRYRDLSRVERPRRLVTVNTPWGEIQCKVADGDGLPTVAKPEDSEIATLAERAKIPAKTVREHAMLALSKLLQP
jgi:uncharacterized protein (TIGR00299 family) protein